jgi:DNA gyrase subunit A
VAGLLSFQPDERIAQVLAIRDYDQAPYLVLATRSGLVKKTRLGDYNSPRQAGVIAINFREDDDELIGAELANSDDDILLVSRKGQAIRFRADDGQLRPMGRATSGVTGMKFRGGDELLSMSVIRAEQVAAEERAEQESGLSGAEADLPGVEEQYVFTITDGGFAKRTRISEYRLQSRGGIGIKAMKQDDERGNLVGAFIVVAGDEVLCIKQSGQVTRSAIDASLRPTGRDTKGVRFVGVKDGDGVAVVARSVERAPEIDEAIEAAADAEPEADPDDGRDPVAGGTLSEEQTAGTETVAADATIDEEAPTEDAPTGAGYPVDGAGTTVDDADPEES